MTHYVLGLAFSESGNEIAMIRKTRGPKSLHGKWNGLGGKIKQGELPREAMTREFEEESGIFIPTIDWDYIAELTLRDGLSKIHVFSTFTDKIFDVKTVEEEIVAIQIVDDIESGDNDIVDHVPLFITLCFDDSVRKPVYLDSKGN